LHALGNYVLFTSEGDTVAAVSSGFTIAKQPTTSPELVAAANQKLDDGANAGELDFSFDKVAYAKSYMYQYTPDPLTENSDWESQVGTVRKVSFSNLESGKKYWCRVMAIGINGQGVYSEPISRIAQ
ncbi:MAG: fibronectin type III domain-containing protein, partial [Ginsengibacter sp.]